MFVLIILVSLTLISAEIDFAEKDHLLPPLFHLDDYGRCLSDDDGLYCLGIFDLKPAELPNPGYDLMKEFSREITNFNRTRIHRGYCVSTRCPTFEGERNASLRFERCAAQRAQQRALNSTLRELKYCHYTRDHNKNFEPDPPFLIFVSICGAIILLNIIGTVYDMSTKDGKTRNALLLSWSIVFNWRRLTTHDSSDASKMSIGPGLKILLMIIMILVHTGILHHTAYLQNPLNTEQMTRHPLTMIAQNGSSSIQLYVILSTFMGTCYLLKSAKNGPIGFKTLWKHILRRWIRLTPVHLFVVGFAATTWRWLGDGPLWSAVVGEETDICRRKFWMNVLYVSNLVEPNASCILPTWFLCTDLQLYIAGAIFTALLNRFRYAISALTLLFVLSCVMNSVLAYVYDWTAMLNVVQSPEQIRRVFRDSPSHYNFYISPWAGLPTCFLGLIAAYYANNRSPSQDKGVVSNSNPQSSKFQVLKLIGTMFCLLTVFLWLLVGIWVKLISNRLFQAVYVAVERAIFLAAITVTFWAVHQIKLMKSIFSWHGWVTLSRLSLPVMLIHWAMIMTVVARRTHLVDVTLFSLVMDGISIGVSSYLLAVPVCLFIEMPFQKFLDTIIS